MASPSHEPVEPFETWLLRPVVQAVEAGEVPADLLAELQAEFEASNPLPSRSTTAIRPNSAQFPPRRLPLLVRNLRSRSLSGIFDPALRPGFSTGDLHPVKLLGIERYALA
jgi:hypothetical protein